MLSFPYSFHHKRALESADQVGSLLRSWLGEGASLELRLQESASAAAGGSTAPARPAAPEEDPVIKAAERKVEGRVVRVRPLKEAP